MFFSKIVSFAILAASVAADTHDSCVCVNGGTTRADLTSAACSSYNAAQWKWGVTAFDKVSARCVGVNGGRLAGDQWESACQTAAQHTSFDCPDGHGKCYASPDQVRGSC